MFYRKDVIDWFSCLNSEIDKNIIFVLSTENKRPYYMWAKEKYP